jgi:probable FeS assembly SUF system protein SufT
VLERERESGSRSDNQVLANPPITLKRDCEGIQIPSGIRQTLAAGTDVRIMQSLGSSYTVASVHGMSRIDARDADALGLTVPAPEDASTEQAFSEKLVWDQLKTVYDPEIPISVADLGLIYSCVATPLEHGGKRVDIKMSMTAPGCGMGDVLKADVEGKLSRLPEVKEVHVEIVFEPPWGPERMSEAAKLRLGFDI